MNHNQNYTEEEKRQLVRQCRASGLSIAEFSRQLGVGKKQLYGWLRSRPESSQKKFSSKPSTGGFIKLGEPSTVTIELPKGIKLQTPLHLLSKVLAELGLVAL